MAKTIEQTYQKLTDIEHCLKRPGMYIGSTNFHKTRSYLLDENGKFDLYNVAYNPGFVQLFEEIISNSVDEHVRNGNINRIDVTVEKDHIVIYDNGGIPVEMHKEHKMYVPELILQMVKSRSSKRLQIICTKGPNLK
jgi:DNA topoisomerase-2